MRKTRFIENCRCYHLISRLAHQAFFLDDDEKTRAIELLRRVEEFSGVIVLAYAIMSNHFHIFIYVPEPEDIGDEEILRRINALYREASLAQVLGEWTRLKDEEAKLLEYSRPTGKYVSRFGEYRRSFLRRMWNSSEFMRTYKQHFTMSFNARRDHHGTMFEGRYHERNHKPEKPVMWRTAAYVDINAWSAGVVKNAEDGPMRPSALRKAVGIRSSIHFNRYYLSPLLEKGVIARTDSEHPQSPRQRYCLT